MILTDARKVTISVAPIHFLVPRSVPPNCSRPWSLVNLHNSMRDNKICLAQLGSCLARFANPLFHLSNVNTNSSLTCASKPLSHAASIMPCSLEMEGIRACAVVEDAEEEEEMPCAANVGAYSDEDAREDSNI